MMKLMESAEETRESLTTGERGKARKGRGGGVYWLLVDGKVFRGGGGWRFFGHRGFDWRVVCKCCVSSQLLFSFFSRMVFSAVLRNRMFE